MSHFITLTIDDDIHKLVMEQAKKRGIPESKAYSNLIAEAMAPKLAVKGE